MSNLGKHKNQRRYTDKKIKNDEYSLPVITNYPVDDLSCNESKESSFVPPIIKMLREDEDTMLYRLTQPISDCEFLNSGNNSKIKKKGHELFSYFDDDYDDDCFDDNEYYYDDSKYYIQDENIEDMIVGYKIESENIISPAVKGAKRTNLIATLLVQENQLVVHGEKIFHYNSGTGAFDNISGKAFSKFLEAALPEAERSMLNTHQIAEIREKILRMPEVQSEKERFNLADDKMNCLNGVVHVLDTDVELEAHAPENQMDYVIQANFLVGKNVEELFADCPAFTHYVQTKFADDCVNKTKLLLEMIGYLLSDSIAGKCFLVGVGAANSGKSVLGKLLIELLNVDKVSHIPIQKLGEQFYLAQFYGKKANIVLEMSNVNVKGIDVIKLLTSGDAVTAANKGEAPFSFVPSGKLLFFGNTLPVPSESDPSEGFYNRLRVLHFSKSIAKEDQDPELMNKLLLEKDKIFTLAVHAFAELRRNNFAFHRVESSERFLDMYKTEADSAKVFVKTMLQADEKGRVAVSDLNSSYEKFCKQNCFKKVSSTELKNIVTMFFPNCKYERKRFDGRNVYGFTGLTMLPLTEPSDE